MKYFLFIQVHYYAFSFCDVFLYGCVFHFFLTTIVASREIWVFFTCHAKCTLAWALKILHETLHFMLLVCSSISGARQTSEFKAEQNLSPVIDPPYNSFNMTFLPNWWNHVCAFAAVSRERVSCYHPLDFHMFKDLSYFLDTFLNFKFFCLHTFIIFYKTFFFLPFIVQLHTISHHFFLLDPQHLEFLW